MMEQLYDHLVQQLEHDQIVLPDDRRSAKLSMEMLEELRLFPIWKPTTEKLIQIVFVGQPEFEEKLDRPSWCSSNNGCRYAAARASTSA